MAIVAKRKGETELEDEAIADAVRSFINLQARAWVREQKNRVLPRVIELADEARARGKRVDVPGILKTVWMEGGIAQLGVED